jgi:hypothetical protein
VIGPQIAFRVLAMALGPAKIPTAPPSTPTDVFNASLLEIPLVSDIR